MCCESVFIAMQGQFELTKDNISISTSPETHSFILSSPFPNVFGSPIEGYLFLDQNRVLRRLRLLFIFFVTLHYWMALCGSALHSLVSLLTYLVIFHYLDIPTFSLTVPGFGLLWPSYSTKD